MGLSNSGWQAGVSDLSVRCAFNLLMQACTVTAMLQSAKPPTQQLLSSHLQSLAATLCCWLQAVRGTTHLHHVRPAWAGIPHVVPAARICAKRTVSGPSSYC